MNDIANTWMWLGFSVFLVVALSVDTFLLDKKHARAHESIRVALYWSLTWIACALIFNVLLWAYLYMTTNPLAAEEISLDFLTGYLIEKSLSIDNLFAFYLIFHQFQVPNAYQQRVFSYGVWSAIVLRLLLILFGTWLIKDFHWILYLFGIFLLLTGIKMLFAVHEEKNLLTSRTFLWLKRHIRITDTFHGQNFFVAKNGLLYATPLLIVLIFIEISDLLFAFDSIPAIFAITTDPFIVWTSNIFAILGLRAMYFLLSGMVTRLHLLKYGIAIILVFVGAKMLIAPWITIPVELSLCVIAAILLLFTGLSLYFKRK
jgi:TerC family integral membrane protein